VRISAKVHTWYRQRRRQWSALRARLRHQRAAVALVALLSVSLGEPLLCIIHCQLWIPFAYQSYFATQHPHAHHTSATHSGPTHAAGMLAQATGAPQAGAVAPATGPTCFMGLTMSDVPGAPFHVPPSPVHDMLTAFVTVIAFMLIVRVGPAAAPGHPPNVPRPPQLRPPIPFAA
jgi:hypothetical protein